MMLDTDQQRETPWKESTSIMHNDLLTPITVGGFISLFLICILLCDAIRMHAVPRFRVHSRDILMQGVVRRSGEPDVGTELAFLCRRNEHV